MKSANKFIQSVNVRNGFSERADTKILKKKIFS